MHLRRGLTAVALLVLLMFGSTGLPAGAQQPDETPPDETTAVDGERFTHSWSLSPARSADPDLPGNRPVLVYDVAPGTTIQDAVTLSNRGNVQLDFDLYATDAFNTADGGFGLLPAEESPADVGSWVELGQDGVTVPPGMAVTIPMTITVPADARPGDHVGAVLAGSPAPGRGPDGAVVSIDRRTGTRIYLRVQGELVQDLDVGDIRTTYTPSINPMSGSAQVDYRVENRGNVRMAGRHVVTVAGPFGLAGSQSDVLDLPELLPGESVELSTTVDGVPAAFVASATVRIEPEAAEGATDAPVSERSNATVAVPVTLLALLAVAALGWFAWRSYRRHGQPPPGRGRGREPAPEGPPSGGAAFGESSRRADRVLEGQR